MLLRYYYYGYLHFIGENADKEAREMVRGFTVEATFLTPLLPLVGSVVVGSFLGPVRALQGDSVSH